MQNMHMADLLLSGRKKKKNKAVESIGRVNVGVATILQQSISGLTVHNSRLNQRGW